ncbi:MULTISPECIES: acylphosphatase [Thioalkalivibrio]|uniref:acylphosphatase n=1 Tax=Thioalkalivibrio halophilus TaxID=252474 RepID=A0A1V2ZZ22_9GAMM|nr:MULTISPECIES: acylphosphatase [Thioalkalivibrio]OOC10357.1 acylphosphatase [Thioalkalivibrio halophilus]
MTEANDNRARRWRVSGRVQGVFFRASTQKQARPLGLTGHARNLPDGSVEVLAVGSPEALDRLGTWLQEGPRQARVDDLQVEDVPIPQPPPERFTTG